MTVTSGIKLRIASESTYGTAPTGAYNLVRMTSEDLSPNLEYVESNAIRSDGQITEVIRTDAMGGGSLAGELCYDSVFDDLAEGSMAASTSTLVTAATGTAVAVAASSTVPGNFTIASGTPFANFTAGMWIVVTGSSAANRLVYKITAISEDDQTIYVIGNPVAGHSGTSSTFTPLRSRENGKTIPTFSLEREDSDDTNEVEQYTGMSVQTLELTVPTTGIITYSFSMEGKKPSSQASTASGSEVAAATTSPMAAADVVQFWEGDTDLGDITATGTSHPWDENPFQLLDFSLSITPNVRQRKKIGAIGPALAPGRGDIGVTGSFRCYYNEDGDGSAASRTNKTLIDKALNDTASSLAFYVKDAAGNGYIFDLPRVQFTNATHTTPGKSEDVIVEVEFQAYRNELDVNPETGVTGTTIRIASGTSLT